MRAFHVVVACCLVSSLSTAASFAQEAEKTKWGVIKAVGNVEVIKAVAKRLEIRLDTDSAGGGSAAETSPYCDVDCYYGLKVAAAGQSDLLKAYRAALVQVITAAGGTEIGYGTRTTGDVLHSFSLSYTSGGNHGIIRVNVETRLKFRDTILNCYCYEHVLATPPKP
jgi:hypothetical protein